MTRKHAQISHENLPVQLKLKHYYNLTIENQAKVMH